MNGPHDVGGMMGFGPIAPEKDEPVFHEPWERRVFAAALAMGATGTWNIDISRHARERIPAVDYWNSSYYEIWFKGLLRLLQEHGLASAEEISSSKSSLPPAKVKRVLTKDMVQGALAKGGPANRPLSTNAKFKPGDKVRTKNIHPDGHTRLPRYVRGHMGEIVLIHGTHVLPDSSAHGKGDDPNWLYAVRFTAKELWNKATPDTVMLDLWEPYLDPA
ncbi:MAG: nitrile hydratase subunit beta [Aestuariivirga sp.]